MNGPHKETGRTAPFIAAAGLALVLWAWAAAWAARSCSSPAPAEAPRAVVARVDVNSADATALQALPGVGRTLAERIVAEREANGPFGAPKHLMRVRGFTPELIERIGDFVIPGEPPPPAQGGPER